MRGERGPHRGLPRRVWNNDNRNHSEHDDRSSDGNRRNVRGVKRNAFKSNRHRSRTLNIPSHLLGSDVVMDSDLIGREDSEQRSRGYGRHFRNRGGRSATARGVYHQGRRDLWAEVVVTDGRNYDKATILNAVGAITSSVIHAYNYAESEKDNSAFFYINDSGIIEKFKQTRAIRMLDGKNLSMRTFGGRTPETRITPAVIELLGTTMSSRYDLVNKSLNMVAFDRDQAFREVYITLRDTNVLRAIIGIIKQYASDAEIIDLSSNRGMPFHRLSSFRDAMPNLRVLQYRDNAVPDVNRFSNLNGWKLTEINLEGNPCYASVDSPSYRNYYTKLREYFPTLEKLDGRDLPKRPKFDVEVNKEAPPIKPGHCPEALREIVGNFISQYYQIFDSGNRADLLAAYNDNATLSFSCIVPLAKGALPVFQSCRNLILKDRIVGDSRKMSTGKYAIMSTLEAFPKTTHDMSTLIIDVPFVTDRFIIVDVTGFLREASPDAPQIFNFSRSFILVPEGTGHTITNDLFYLGKAHHNVGKIAFQQPLPQSIKIEPSPSSDLMKMREMVLLFTQQTGLKPDWAEKCLMEHGWDFAKAGEAFLACRPNIPAEAFIGSPV